MMIPSHHITLLNIMIMRQLHKSNRVFLNTFNQFLNSSSKPIQFSNYYLLKIHYGVDGYYETYPYRKEFAEQIKQLESTQQARILGGDNYPKNCTTLLFHCNSIDVVQNFAKNCEYAKKKYVTDVELKEVEKISSESFQKIWQFYQPKVQ